jgi:hypothetical protein
VTPEFYVYILFRDNGLPFYVGKGRGRRWTVHEWQASKGRKGHRFSIIRDMQARGIEIPKIKLHEGLTETVAHDYETALIKAIRRKPEGPLVNLTDGGEGSTGYRFAPELVRRGFTLAPETRAKIAAKRLGTKRSPEATEKIVTKLRGRKQNPERIEKRVSKIRGRKYSPEHVENMAAALRGRKLSDEHARKVTKALQSMSDDPQMVAGAAEAGSARRERGSRTGDVVRSRDAHEDIDEAIRVPGRQNWTT